ncbi:MAG: transcription elongation factor GreA [Clostridia bacterium]|nr:transcription elongation factor GreA [Oscillospiraceae bacterium]MBQ2774043.1 transcription elongation factor GreA [Clostridia bacterium]MBQ3055886.1 transcription elongation factor GreA [Clostridia bacterium]MBR2312837.1 transcription elongation factor GreA [Clostridia bacterium]MBR2464206.1 transcription elongation factor GreA [Clostridia bacterium]
MANVKKITMTQEGYNELVKELQWREGEERERIKNDIVTARGFGDLSENAEYDAARNAQAENEARILKLKYDIENAEVYDASKAVRGVIDIGSVIKVYDEDFKEECNWRIVGSNEADVVSGKISDQSPVGKALIGHRAGDVVTGVVEASGYNFTYRILEVGRD